MLQIVNFNFAWLLFAFRCARHVSKIVVLIELLMPLVFLVLLRFHVHWVLAKWFEVIIENLDSTMWIAVWRAAM